jgi:hypothetical protein
MNEAEALAAMKRGEGEATESHHYLPELMIANEAFGSARGRFFNTKKDGARRMRGNAAAARDLWSMRALRVGIE